MVAGLPCGSGLFGLALGAGNDVAVYERLYAIGCCGAQIVYKLHEVRTHFESLVEGAAALELADGEG